MFHDYTAQQDAGPNDEERGQPSVPIAASVARSSSSVSFALGAAMSSPSPSPSQFERVERGGIALVGCVLLLFLALAWTGIVIFSASEPSFIAALIGIPTFFLTPMVSGCLLFLLRR